MVFVCFAARRWAVGRSWFGQNVFGVLFPVNTLQNTAGFGGMADPVGIAPKTDTFRRSVCGVNSILAFARPSAPQCRNRGVNLDEIETYDAADLHERQEPAPHEVADRPQANLQVNGDLPFRFPVSDWISRIHPQADLARDAKPLQGAVAALHIEADEVADFRGGQKASCHPPSDRASADLEVSRDLFSGPPLPFVSGTHGINLKHAFSLTTISATPKSRGTLRRRQRTIQRRPDRLKPRLAQEVAPCLQTQ